MEPANLLPDSSIDSTYYNQGVLVPGLVNVHANHSHTMAGEDTKEEQDALDALEVEAKEFDKVNLTRPPPGLVTSWTV